MYPVKTIITETFISKRLFQNNRKQLCVKEMRKQNLMQYQNLIYFLIINNTVQCRLEIYERAR